MKHLGDITLIKGNEAPVVDCIIGGSPCQGLSLAGKRKGFDDERSGLYMEQIRIIKEMREEDVRRGKSTVDVRPRYMVWENVPGAFSTNQGQDFAAVLEEAVRVAEPQAPDIPVPEKGWPTSGCLIDEMGRWSIAWRVMDAQYFGVPQRRRRIAMVCDWGGLNAPKILFGEAEHHRSTERDRGDAPVRYTGDESRPQVQPVSQGLSGHPDESKPQGQEVAGDVGNGIEGAIPYTLKIRGGREGGGKGALIQEDKSATLSTLQDQTLFQPVYGIDQQGGKGGANYSENVSPPILSDSHGTPHAVCYGISPYHSNCMKSDNPNSGYYEADTARSLDAMNCGYPACNQGGMAVVQPVAFDTYNMVAVGEKTVTHRAGAEHNYAPVFQPILDDQGGSQISVRNDGKCPTLRAETHGNLPCVMNTVCLEGNGSRPSHKGDGYIESDKMYTLNTIERHGVAYSIENHPADSRVPMVMETFHATVYENVSPPLKARDYKDPHIVAGVDCRNGTEYPEMNGTIQAKPNGGFNLNSNQVVRVKHIVRRLTPLECERLQGFPDGWTDIGEWVDSKGKKHKEADSPRYRALGNSIAIPPWKWILKRLCACYERDATMASLFDGIGGFPYIWEQINGKGSCLWASEIEEFPMAVTRARFGGVQNE